MEEFRVGDYAVSDELGAEQAGSFFFGEHVMLPRKAAIKGGSKAAGLAAIGAELALAYAQQAMEAAGEAASVGKEKLGEFGGTAAVTARSAGRTAADRAGEVSEAALAVTRDAGKRLGKAIRSRVN